MRFSISATVTHIQVFHHLFSRVRSHTTVPLTAVVNNEHNIQAPNIQPLRGRLWRSEVDSKSLPTRDSEPYKTRLCIPKPAMISDPKPHNSPTPCRAAMESMGASLP